MNKLRTLLIVVACIATVVLPVAWWAVYVDLCSLRTTLLGSYDVESFGQSFGLVESVLSSLSVVLLVMTVAIESKRNRDTREKQLADDSQRLIDQYWSSFKLVLELYTLNRDAAYRVSRGFVATIHIMESEHVEAMVDAELESGTHDGKQSSTDIDEYRITPDDLKEWIGNAYYVNVDKDTLAMSAISLLNAWSIGQRQVSHRVPREVKDEVWSYLTHFLSMEERIMITYLAAGKYGCESLGKSLWLHQPVRSIVSQNQIDAIRTLIGTL